MLVRLAPPTADFALRDALSRPLRFVSAGSRVTPVIADAASDPVFSGCTH